jgi:hypothetical protein
VVFGKTTRNGPDISGNAMQAKSDALIFWVKGQGLDAKFLQALQTDKIRGFERDLLYLGITRIADLAILYQGRLRVSFFDG